MSNCRVSLSLADIESNYLIWPFLSPTRGITDRNSGLKSHDYCFNLTTRIYRSIRRGRSIGILVGTESRMKDMTKGINDIAPHIR